MQTTYIIALGSNRRHGRFGAPEYVIDAALVALDLPIATLSKTIRSAPLGPSSRTYANAVAIVETEMSPPDMLNQLKIIEYSFGRRRGQRWGARVIDMDIVLWSGGCWAAPDLVIPHPLFRERDFVLAPLAAVAGEWKDPMTGLSVLHLKARLDRKRPSP